DREKLDVREAEPADVLDELSGELAVGERATFLHRDATPRSDVELVDRDRRIERVARAARLHPRTVTPLVVELPHHGGWLRPQLAGEREGIRLLEWARTVSRSDPELVERARLDVRDEPLPHAGRTAWTQPV